MASHLWCRRHAEIFLGVDKCVLTLVLVIMPHGHSHGSCGQECDHDDASDADRGHLFSLFQKIDTDRLECLNEMDEGSGKTIFKSWDQRLDTQKVRCAVRIIAQVVYSFLK